MLTSAFIGILIPFAGTTIGSACVFFMKKSLHPGVQRALTGFAAGVMVAASIWSLLFPAMEQSAALGQLAFLPAACTRTDETPVYLDGSGNRAETSAAILALQIKRLISVDFALPLKGFDYAGYEAWPIRGSMALTAAGQEALDSLDIQGCGA